jgi:hypothetical protein
MFEGIDLAKSKTVLTLKRFDSLSAVSVLL